VDLALKPRVGSGVGVAPSTPPVDLALKPRVGSGVGVVVVAVAPAPPTVNGVLAPPSSLVSLVVLVEEVVLEEVLEVVLAVVLEVVLDVVLEGLSMPPTPLLFAPLVADDASASSASSASSAASLADADDDAATPVATGVAASQQTPRASGADAISTASPTTTVVAPLPRIATA